MSLESDLSTGIKDLTNIAEAHDSSCPDGLTPRQHVVLAALLTGASVTSAAEAAGLRRETVSRWLNHDDQFNHALEARRAELFRGVRDQLLAAAEKAAGVLLELLDGDQDSKVRLGAARAVLGLAGIGSASGRNQPAAPRQVLIDARQVNVDHAEAVDTGNFGGSIIPADFEP